MSFRKKFIIPDLNKKLRLEEAAEIIVRNKLGLIRSEIDRYFKNDSTENLHSLRIAFRRLRYSLELFYDCFPAKTFKKTLTLLKDLQDLLGKARDIDVLISSLKSLEEEINLNIPELLYEKTGEENNKLRQNIKSELIKFIDSKEINKFNRY
jgi:CHAD domain-containing protein